MAHETNGVSIDSTKTKLQHTHSTCIANCKVALNYKSLIAQDVLRNSRLHYTVGYFGHAFAYPGTGSDG